MAPRSVAKTELSNFLPTAAQLEAARRTILAAEDPGKAERAMMANMVHWCKSQKCSMEALQASGTARKDFMLKYAVWQLQDKKARAEKTTTRTISDTKAKMEDSGWRSFEWMKKEVGQDKLKAWVDAKVIPVRADERTGSEELHMQEFYYEKKWQRKAVTDDVKEETASKIQNITDKAVEEANERADSIWAFDNPCGSSGSGGGDANAPAPGPPGGEVVVKVEKADEMAKMVQAKITMMKANAAEQLTTLQKNAIEIKNLRRIASSMKYQESFVVGLDKFSKGKLAKTIRMLEQVLDPDVVVDSNKCAGLLHIIDQVTEEHAAFLTHADKFGWKGFRLTAPTGGESGAGAPPAKRRRVNKQ